MRVAVEVIHKAMIDGDRPASEVARELGFMRHKNGRVAPDTTRFLRAVGMRAYRKKGHSYTIKTVTYERAVGVIIALGLEPADYGL